MNSTVTRQWTVRSRLIQWVVVTDLSISSDIIGCMIDGCTPHCTAHRYHKTQKPHFKRHRLGSELLLRRAGGGRGSLANSTDFLQGAQNHQRGASLCGPLRRETALVPQHTFPPHGPQGGGDHGRSSSRSSSEILSEPLQGRPYTMGGDNHDSESITVVLYLAAASLARMDLRNQLFQPRNHSTE